MINGEGAEEKLSSPFTSPYDPSCDRESDGGDEQSHYSSCGGESEFDRYCSASSAMGTPRTFSSSFHDSDFGSLKSFKLGGENTIGAERKLSGFHEWGCGSGTGRGTEFYHGREDGGVSNLNRRMEDFVVNDVDVRGNCDVDGNIGNEVVNESENRGEVFEIDDDENRKLSDEGEDSSRYEHSEGENSMFGCGSDDERKIDMYYGENTLFRGEKSGKNENQLAMNSAVAFGSDDWDDFVHESSGNNIGSMVWDEILGERQICIQSGIANGVLHNRDNEVRSTPADCKQIGSNLAETNVSTLSTNSTNFAKNDERVEDVKAVVASSNQVSDIDELEEYLGCTSGPNIFQLNNEELRIGETEIKNEDTATSAVMPIRHDIALRHIDLDKRNIEPNPLSESVVNHHNMVPVKDEEDREVKVLEEHNPFVLSSLDDTTTSGTNKQDLSFSFDQIEDHFVPVETRGFELNDFCDEIVNDMEDILLDSGESLGSRFAHGTRIYQSQLPLPSRDGGSSASTSGTDYAYNLMQPLKIDRIEVVGSRQKKGEVSFSERLVGVQKYTVYMIRVFSGTDHWDVERRYRDFSTLYHRLKKLFADHGWTLPSPWFSVERESRKLFGNASPDVIADRSVLIQECLQSIIHPKFSSISLNALACFLSPSEVVSESPASDTCFPNKNSTLGNTISLIVQIRPLKSMKQMLDGQHYRCAGCHRNFDDGRTRVVEFVQSLGWGKPRLCEYSGQLFCSSCHNNDTAVLPARVLHYWDFTRYPVSLLAKSFLDSISDQPMLCVSAVNPFLFSKVPTLQHVANIRNRISAMLPYVRCPFRRSIYKGLGSRRYLLDSNDFFALRDLIDLSKGVFSALPVMVETVSRKIEEHITEQCLVCYDVGIPCSARQDCDNPLSLIFPFQAREVKKCRSCELVFHKNCFKKIACCPCGTHFKPEGVKQSSDKEIHSMDGNLSLVGRTAETSSGLLAGLFSMVMPGKSQILRKQASNVDNVILMGSLPNTSL
ncbi:hypothetical protein BUALT_Bualt07G0028700 [Buddleja alternifolia]|uniref:PX domain-containing protein n=1 Tax=Buddleja alternifolia TaxID=168488 RepID=A0AAV6X7Q8_9LAMI|nr:hypothetical protein BUALT_Bualt07G0028700 [Buddleja alternifolia]